MAGPMGLFEYISDDGNTYHIREDQSNANAFGATPSAGGSRPNLPHGYVPRKIECVDDFDTAGGRTPTYARRVIPANSPTDTQWTGGANVIILDDYSVTPSVAVNWSIWARVGEKRYHR